MNHLSSVFYGLARESRGQTLAQSQSLIRKHEWTPAYALQTCTLPHYSTRYVYYLRQDGDSEGLIVVFTHQVEGDDWEDVPGCCAGLPTYQLLPQPEPRGELLCLKNRVRRTFILSFPIPTHCKSGLWGSKAEVEWEKKDYFTDTSCTKWKQHGSPLVTANTNCSSWTLISLLSCCFIH